jgi:sugar lactone lactonase YvrE
MATYVRGWPWRVVFGPLAVGLLVAAGCSEPTVVLSTPESVVFDATADVYLIANIVGAPLDKDDNGRIVRVDPVSGHIADWIRGGVGGVTLHAPKGMALVGDELWVADIDVVRVFHRTTGAPRRALPIPGAAFLNDVAAAADGTVYVTDTGLDATFGPTGTDAIWRIGTDGSITTLAHGTELGQPNGIVVRDGACYVVGWRDGAFYQIDHQGRRTDLAKAPSAQLDGLVRVVDGDGRAAYYATSWQGNCVYRFDVVGGVTALPTELRQPADLGYDELRKCLVIPLFGENRFVTIRL